jgi:hypothetical protein
MKALKLTITMTLLVLVSTGCMSTKRTAKPAYYDLAPLASKFTSATQLSCPAKQSIPHMPIASVSSIVWSTIRACRQTSRRVSFE